MHEYTRRLLHLAVIEADAIDQYGYREPATTLDAHLDDVIDRGHTFEMGSRTPDSWLRIEHFRIGADDAPLFRAAVALLLEPGGFDRYMDPAALYRAAKARTGQESTSPD